jgi:GNAT superfamily N-acetyltransferase
LSTALVQGRFRKGRLRIVRPGPAPPEPPGEEIEMMRMRTAADGSPIVEVEDRPGLLLPRVVLRPLDRGETAPLERVFAGLSLRSRRMRFLTGTPSLGPAVVDQDRHGAWVASVGSDPVAIGRYITTKDDPAVAEIALEVVDRYQSHGLGGLLVDVIGAAAADVGVTTLLWLMDETNLRVRHLAVTLQGRFRLEYGVIEGTTALPVVPELDAAQIVRCARAARRRLAERVAA